MQKHLHRHIKIWTLEKHQLNISTSYCRNCLNITAVLFWCLLVKAWTTELHNKHNNVIITLIASHFIYLSGPPLVHTNSWIHRIHFDMRSQWKDQKKKKMPRTQRHNNEHGRYVHASGAWWECRASWDQIFHFTEHWIFHCQQIFR